MRFLQIDWLLINFLMIINQKYTVVYVFFKLKTFLYIVILDIYKCLNEDWVCLKILIYLMVLINRMSSKWALNGRSRSYLNTQTKIQIR